jgi:hypothetical protein
VNVADLVTILKQAAPAARILTGVYAVPDNTRAVLSSLVVCNQGDSRATFRVTLAPNGDADEPKHYLYHDEPIDAHRTFAATLGVTLGARTVVRVYSSTGLVSFQVLGAQKAA